jgi:sporulation protein YlmC with PRC-barrel domain
MHAEITSLLGLEVYTQKAVFVGRVDDIVLNPEQGEVSGLAWGTEQRPL